MEEAKNIISEEFRKWLIEVVYKEQHYFTVWGSDRTDNDNDKWLVDEVDRMMFISDVTELRNLLMADTYFFDNENLKKWINHPGWKAIPDNLLDLDLLVREGFNHLHPLLDDLYILIGLIEDFAIQRNEEGMMALFRSDLFMQFKDEAANTFLWAGQDEFDKNFDFTTLMKECHNIHRDLSGKISFMN
ncbi:hypothetical protein [Chitinophaga sp. S165]|uniref:hypothetical protein n=1 Tax=Chitinophaga sp. S165 TaxID=2135462 RepID=UPI000D713B87|nr:hypothetical protein [Chitinophaga sp. S165]PWV49136.1 hypothetical protein C7475_106382 [Chitinophaga sp. S165]